jgi:hypothetical protein
VPLRLAGCRFERNALCSCGAARNACICGPSKSDAAARRQTRVSEVPGAYVDIPYRCLAPTSGHPSNDLALLGFSMSGLSNGPLPNCPKPDWTDPPDHECPLIVQPRSGNDVESA